MVFENDCTKMILDYFPEFEKSKQWKEHIKFWDSEEPGLCSNMSTFSSFIKDQLNNNTNMDFKKVFDFIEHLIVNGDQGVKEAATTCFLENLINLSSWDEINPRQFVNFLGPQSKKYCKTWDEFTGVKTEGLYD